MNQEDIHYRTGGTITHAGCEILPGGYDIPAITIERIEFKDRERINGQNQEGVWVAHFANNDYTALPWIVNATNRKRLAKMFREDYLARLHNVTIRMTKERTRDPNGGGMTDGLRVALTPAIDLKQLRAELDACTTKTALTDKYTAINGARLKGVKEYYDKRIATL